MNRKDMKHLFNYWALFVVATGLFSCKEGGKSILTPASSGIPYEIMVVAEDNCWTGGDSALFKVLDTNVPALPSPERSFRISHIRPSYYDRHMRLFRNIIIVDINPNLYTQTKFKYARDVYSSPPMIMSIQSPNQTEFDKYVSAHGQVIIDFFTRAEMNREIELLRKKHNGVISSKADSIFGCDVWLPFELCSYKVGENFFWASSNLNDLNFVMYSYPYRDSDTFTKAYFLAKRDSVMKQNIPGAREGMYMETADSSFVSVRDISVRGNYAFEVKGLWEMKNDAMGGPFVSHARVDQKNGRVVVVEGFVYYPQGRKRDKIRSLNASLYTLILPEEKDVPEIPVDKSVTKEDIVKNK